MSGYDYFAVITGDPYYSEPVIFRTVGDAVDYRIANGGEVYALKPLPVSALWEWAVDHGFGNGPSEYVNESAARNSVHGDGKLFRRRAGSSEWQPVSTEDGDR